MTAKEKAKELVNKFIQINGNSFFAKECTLLCVNEIIDAIDWHEFETPNKQINFWLDVRKEINSM